MGRLWAGSGRPGCCSCRRRENRVRARPANGPPAPAAPAASPSRSLAAPPRALGPGFESGGAGVPRVFQHVDVQAGPFLLT